MLTSQKKSNKLQKYDNDVIFFLLKSNRIYLMPLNNKKSTTDTN
jgi:hypothetical protein